MRVPGSDFRTHNGHPAPIIRHDSDGHFRWAIVECFQPLVKNPNEFGARDPDFSHAPLLAPADGAKPGDDSHSLTCEAVSSWRALQQFLAFFAVRLLLSFTPKGFACSRHFSSMDSFLRFIGCYPSHRTPKFMIAQLRLSRLKSGHSQVQGR